MAIRKAVGPRMANSKNDVKIVQILLNGNKRRFGLSANLGEDGAFGAKTAVAIRDFQARAMGVAEPSGVIAPGDATLIALRDGLEPGVSADRVAGIMVHSKRSAVETYQPALARELARNEISSPKRMAHFLAQVGHESGGFRFSEELASGAAYEGRRDLGNTRPGDGKRFKGRGLIQLTGRANYKAFGAFVGKDLLSDDGARTVAKDPGLAVLASVWFWTTKKLNRFADADDVVTITKRINGGTNGLDDRRDYLFRSRFFLNA